MNETVHTCTLLCPQELSAPVLTLTTAFASAVQPGYSRLPPTGNSNKPNHPTAGAVVWWDLTRTHADAQTHACAHTRTRMHARARTHARTRTRTHARTVTAAVAVTAAAAAAAGTAAGVGAALHNHHVAQSHD